VLVHAQPGGETLTGQLRPLLEVEVSHSWEGALLERAEIDRLLQELKLAAAGGAAPLQLGTMARAAALIDVQVFPDHVQCTVTGVPGAEVIREITYRDRLDAESLATRIASEALTAIRLHRKDPKTPDVAVGSVYCVDPHLRFFTFSREVETALRARLVDIPAVHQVERLFPSALLHELDLGRAGLTVGRFTDFNAPPSDVLVYAECKPQTNQELTALAAILDCTITVLSPTSLFPTLQETLTCAANAPDSLAERAQRLTERAVGLATASLTVGKARSFSAQEFGSFKKQAFRLMPNPPPEGLLFSQSGYSISEQKGTHEELERSLRMLECALLFKGDDTELLVGTSVIIGQLAVFESLSSPAQKKLLASSLALSERAYFLESNYNTCGCFAQAFLYSSKPDLPAMLSASRQILNTRANGYWEHYYIFRAWVTLLSIVPSQEAKVAFIIKESTEEQRKWDLPAIVKLLAIFLPLKTEFAPPFTDPDQHLREAELLIRSDSPLFQLIGHLFALVVRQFEIA